MVRNLTASVSSILKLLALNSHSNSTTAVCDLIITHKTRKSSNNDNVTQYIFYLQDIRRILDDLHLQKYQVDMVVNCTHQELHPQNQLA